MATVRLSDAIIPAVYLSYSALDNIENNAFWQSGIVASSALFSQIAAGPGRTAEMPFWRDIDQTVEPNYGNDDPDDKITPEKIGSGVMNTRKAFVNKAFSTMDLVQELAGSNPMQHIRNRFGTYWQRSLQRRLLAATYGLWKDNVAGNSGDMVYDISQETTVGLTAANLFSRAAFVTAAFTMGDQVDSVMAIAVHSVVYKRMTDNDDIEFIPDSKGQLTIPTYLGRRIIVDDGMPVIAGTTSGFRYVSVLFGAAAFGFGRTNAPVPMAVVRDELAGSGQGMETIIERDTWLLHPFGYRWTETTVSEESPTLADLKLATNWTRIVARKNVPLAFLITNG